MDRFELLQSILHLPCVTVGYSFLIRRPETTIGFFPDVGGTHILPRLCKGKYGLGMFLGLTGKRLKGTDLFISGIATHLVLLEFQKKLLETLESIDLNGESLSKTLNQFHCMQTSKDFFLTPETLSSMDAAFGSHIDSIEAVFKSLDELAAGGNQFAIETRNDLLKKSPSALKTTFRAIRANAGNVTLADALKLEFRLANRMSAAHDFKEGVRALLIDKDKKPKWIPSTLATVSETQIDSYFAPFQPQECPEFDPLLMPSESLSIPH